MDFFFFIFPELVDTLIIQESFSLFVTLQRDKLILESPYLLSLKGPKVHLLETKSYWFLELVTSRTYRSQIPCSLMHIKILSMVMT